MEIIKINNEEFIHIFGGYNWKNVTNYNLQHELNDFWKYSIDQNTWLQILTSSSVPNSRYGANIRWIDEQKLFLFGGINSKGVLNDSWLYNINSNKWIEIIMTNSTETDWPIPVKYSTLQKYSNVI